ncbi:unnamed protein product [Rotaria magnacalcarata]|uniref:Uncharacterized protein n=3 Tax=Rotaria magnacalcarata TaxID=392030 RepID=A0A815PJ49_9BILA|nr:unnamed protein product [Rotaria magnacalcarata]CAF4352560.1 unnamed protein product [Rotaria magnacalcarata]
MFHQPFYPSPQQATSYHNHHGQNHFYIPTQSSSFYRSGPIPNQSSHHVNLSGTYEYFPSSLPHGFPSSPPHGFPSSPAHGFPSMTPGSYAFNHVKSQQYYPRAQAYHFQDKSTYYYMSEPIITSNNRITIRLTKVHTGRNGDQQRVFVEQEFSNQHELKKFVKNLKHNFEKTFNNRAGGGHSSNETLGENQHLHRKKAGLVVIEEPDEEPKIYEQKVYNENIESKHKPAEFTYPLVDASKFAGHKQHQRPTPVSSSSTICLNRRQKNKMKYYQQNQNNETNKKNKKQNKKPSNYHHHSQQQQQQQHYEVPPRFQQQFFNDENIFRMTNNFSYHWKFNQYQQPLHHQPYSYVLPMNENLPPSTPSVFHQPRDPYYQSSALPHFVHSNDRYRPQQTPSRPRRGKKHRRNQPTTVTENITFKKSDQEQPRVQRTRSDCRAKPPFQTRIRTCHYLDYGFHPIQRTFVPFIQPRAPIFYPQRRLVRNTQVHFRLFNIYRPNSIRF